jgi:fatty-acyl-CoA synthase
MMDTELNAWLMFEHAPRYAPDAEVVSRMSSGTIHRYDYARFAARTQQLMHALDGLGIERGETVATLAWNSHHHLEAYFAVPCTARVLHTLNARLSAEDLAYIIGHADDRAVLVDPDFLPLLETIRDGLPGARRLLPARHPRAHALGALLHLGDHWAPQGRPVHAPLLLPSRAHLHVGRRLRHRAR